MFSKICDLSDINNEIPHDDYVLNLLVSKNFMGKGKLVSFYFVNEVTFESQNNLKYAYSVIVLLLKPCYYER